MTMFFALVIVATLSGFFLFRTKPASATRTAPAHRAMRITDPRTQNPGGHRLWQLQTSGCQCNSARRLGGRRLDVEDTEPVARAGSGSVTCRCCYRPISDARRQPRREGADRRAELRFDLASNDRRTKGERRRFREAWGACKAH
ncbi:MAG: hypothetical protein R3F01_06445 [Lysobacteraceae bacterium]